MIGFGDPIFDPAERARALAQRGEMKRRAGLTRAYSELWQGMSPDRRKLAESLPSLLETADELETVAAKLGASRSDLHLQKDASETAVKGTALDDYRVIYFATHGLLAGDVKGLGEPALALTLPSAPSALDDGLLTASEVANSSSMPIGLCFRPATRPPAINRVRRHCRVWRAPSSMPAPMRSWCRTGR